MTSAPPGRDTASGFGLLDVGAALAFPAPGNDAFEPNDDIDEVDPARDMYLSKQPPLTTSVKRLGRIGGRVDKWEDPRDVFRVWLPAKRRVVATLNSTDNGDLSLFASTAPTVVGRFATSGRLARANGTGTVERLVYDNVGKGRWAYVAVTLPSTTVSARLPALAELGRAQAAREAPLAGPLDDDGGVLDGRREHDVGLPHPHLDGGERKSGRARLAAIAEANASRRL